jgi:signal transduction histidine kinase/PAS domain-containing protein
MNAESQARLGNAAATRRSFLRASIVWKLTFLVGVLVAFNGAVLIAVAFFTTTSILRDQIDKRLATVATDRQERLTNELREQEQRASQLASGSDIHRALALRASGTITPEQLRAETDPILAGVRANTTGVLALWIEDEDGRVIASGGPENLVALYSGQAKSGEAPGPGRFLPPRRVGNTFGLVSAGVVRSGGGRPLGSVMLLTDFAPVAGFLMDPRGLGETGEVLIGAGMGERIRLILPLRLRPPMEEVAATEVPALRAAIGGRFGSTRTTDYRGEDVLLAYRPIGTGPGAWGLVAKMDTSEAYEPVRRLRFWLLALGALTLALGLAASSVIARRFARPIRQLASTSAALAAGDLSVRSEVSSSDEIGALSWSFNRMTQELSRSYASLEGRISERTRDLEAVRDLLDAFFRISTSKMDPDNIDKTLDSVLRFCARLGYDLAMISLVDRDAGVIRAARAMGTMTGVVEMTVRALDGDDILAVVVREAHTVVIADSRLDPHCDQAAVAVSGIRGQIIVPLVSEQVLGTLQVASNVPLDPERVDLRPLETLATHTVRALTGLRQLEEIRRLNQSQEQHALELARSEAALREQTQILQSVLACMGDGVLVADRNARFLVFNPAAQRILGHGRTDEPPQEWSRHYEFFLPDRSTPYPVEDLPLMRAIRGESVDLAEIYIAYPSSDNGTWIVATGRPLQDEHGVLQGGVVVFHDITLRKKSERRLTAQYETTRVLAEADSPGQANLKILATICESLDWDLGALWRVDPRTARLRCVTIWHRPGVDAPGFQAQSRAEAFGRGTGIPGRVWADAQPVWIPDLARDENFPRRSAALADGLHGAFAVPIIIRGECRGVLEFYSREARPADDAILEMINNVGSQIGQFIERHQMRARVAQSEKLASLGMLSAGVAHEINNPLAYVANNLAVLERDVRFLLDVLALYEQGRDRFATAHPELGRHLARLSAEFDLAYVRENMGKILQSTRHGVKRVADIVQNLRGFARLDRATVDQANIHEALKAALEILRDRLHRQQITVEEHLHELPLVSGSPAQLNQVFLNLLVNAVQAIESTHRADGRIAITTAQEDGEIVIELADNGCGIPDDILPQIFDPFFTTKEVGDGTGLGLSITHSIVQDHGGRLQIESVPGEGTSVRVILPVART